MANSGNTILLWATVFLFGVMEITDGGEPTVHFEPVQTKGFGGVPIQAEIGRIAVPQRHVVPNGPTYELAFVRFRTNNPRPRSPIYFLAGGPGGSGVELSAIMATHPQLRLLEHADVIGIDQRGTGLSRPNLMEPTFSEELRWDAPATRDDYHLASSRCVRQCLEHWQMQGIDLASFNSLESAHDIELIRRSLGQNSITLFGSSYGSHLGLSYLSEYSANVERSILTKVEGLQDTWKYPSTVQTQLERLEKQCEKDAYYASRLPSLTQTIRTLYRQLSTDVVTVQVTDTSASRRAIVLSEYDLAMALSNWLADFDEIARVPLYLLQFSEGNWQKLADFTKTNRRISIEAMPLLMDCASGASSARLKRIEEERNDSQNLLSDGIVSPFFPETCKECGGIDLGEAFRNGKAASVPILFVSGTLDVRTPPANVDSLLGMFKNSAHVLVHQAGHESRELMSVEYRRMVQAFLRGDEVKSCEIFLPSVFLERAIQKQQ
jgi:pimeloyl-ACP methyl ester carboxylesterase